MNGAAVAERLPVAGTQTEQKSLLDSIIDEGRIARDPLMKREAREAIDQLIERVNQGVVRIDADLETILNEQIARIDELISLQLNEVIHQEEFQKLEASWRGFHRLVFESETSTQLEIQVLNITKKEIHKDLTRAAEFDQSNLFKKIYQDGYGVLGGRPFGMIVGDYYFDKGPQDVEILRGMSGIAAAAHAPFITGTDPGMFSMDSFQELENPRDLAKLFSAADSVEWNSFRESDDARYVAMALPHYLSRLPYGKRSVEVEEFAFEEDVNGQTHDKYLWGNAAWLLAGRITDSFARYNWSTTIRGVEGGGMVENLPIHTFMEDGLISSKCPTEIQITETRDKELADLGFISLVHSKHDAYAVFMSGQTAQKPKKYVDAAATANAQLSARLPYILAVSRIAHYLKCIVRDKVGSAMGREALELYLRKWLAQYVLDEDNPPPSRIAERPLREASLKVEEVPGAPGTYQAVAHLRPFIQLEAVKVSLRLVAELPQSK